MGDIHALDTDTLKELVIAGVIEFPNIDEADISDKSKGDGLTKALVLGQTGWFMVQVLARAALNLHITELEVMTVAYATLSFCTYAFWWNKPQHVDRPIKIGSMSHMRSTSPRTENILLPQAPVSPSSNNRSHHLSVIQETDRSNPHGNDDYLPSTMPQHVQTSLMLSVPSQKRRSFSLNTLMQQLHSIMEGFLLPGIHHSSGLNNARLRAGTFSSGRDDAKYIASVPGHRWQWSNLSATFCEGAAAIIFGAIHAAAWSFPYPSKIERILWRVCSLVLIIQPLFLFFVVPAQMQTSANSLRGGRGQDRVLYLLSFYVLAPLYLMARLILLVQPFVLLRKLPPSAFQEVPWSNYFPHVR
jgi:hypothetical protein